MLDTRLNRLSFWALMVPCILAPVALSYVGIRFATAWLPAAAICVVRLHDLGRTGKWVLVPLILQFLAGVIIAQYVPAHQFSAAFFGMFGATMLAIVWLGSEPGQPVSNAWGGPAGPGFSFGKRTA